MFELCIVEYEMVPSGTFRKGFEKGTVDTIRVRYDRVLDGRVRTVEYYKLDWRKVRIVYSRELYG